MKKNWRRLDTAALIFPAIMSNGWSNSFRISFTLKDEIDQVCLLKAINDLRKRFPSYFVKLKKGLFWFYLEENNSIIKPIKDFAYPLTYMSKKDLRKSCIKVLYYENRIAVEFFHSVTDGTGALIFVKNLAARYLFLKYNREIPLTNEIFSLEEEPKLYEQKDYFYKVTNNHATSRKESKSYHFKGHLEYNKFKHLITGIISTDELLKLSHEYGVSATSFLSAVLIESIIKIQEERVKEKRQKPVKIGIAVNLRKVFKVQTFRNFVLALNLGVDPRDGKWSLEEIAKQIQYQLKLETVPQKMAGRVAANVNPQKWLWLRITPLFIKNIILNLIYLSTGEKTNTMCLSNLGDVKVPEEFKEFVTRFEFIIGTQKLYGNNCSVASYNGKTYINMIRNIKETNIERIFFSRLVELGIPVEIETNMKGEK